MIAGIEDSVEGHGRFIGQKPAYVRILNAGVALQLDEKVDACRVKR